MQKNLEDLKKKKKTTQLHQFPFQEISSATDGFDQKNFIAKGGYGSVYLGVSEKHGRIAVKRLDPRHGQGDREFMMEISLLSIYKHENIVSLVGFCNDDGEKILVYKFESNGSLDKHLSNQDLTWIQRLHICLGAACGIAYLHDDNVGFRSGIYHRDVKSPNILLDDKWKPKISDFGLSRVGSMNTFVISNPCGTAEYIDPDYMTAGYLTKKSDVYSFGVVLWEVVCGRPVHPPLYEYKLPSFIKLVERHYTRNTLDKIIPSYLYKQINPVSLSTFTKSAYQCLKNAEERPTMKEVVEQLQLALHNQQVAVSQEVRKPKEEENNAKIEAVKAQEIVLKVLLDCEGCADKVRKSLEYFKGVEKVIAQCGTDTVIVKGNIANPSELVKRVSEKIGRKVELLTPPPTEELKTSRNMSKKPKQQGPAPKQENKKDKSVLVISKECEACAQDTKNSIMKTDETVYQRMKNVEERSTMLHVVEQLEVLHNQQQPKEGKKDEKQVEKQFVLNVFLDCEGCAEKVRKSLKGVEGVEKVIAQCGTDRVIVKGNIANPSELVKRVSEKISRKVELLTLPAQKEYKDEQAKTK